MRFIILLLPFTFLCSCGPDENPDTDVKEPSIDTTLNLPSVADGMAIDTHLSSLRISSVSAFHYSDTSGVDRPEPGALVEFDTTAGSPVVNVYADSSIESHVVDSIINLYCKGKDLHLVGKNNGQEVVIPFHTLHRFPVIPDTLYCHEADAHLIFVDDDVVTGNDLSQDYRDGGAAYFRMFYGDAFNPKDSSNGFPQRIPNRQTVEQLMIEGQGWENSNFRYGSDSAQKLAAYNEFVNKLEIYDKAGSFCIMRRAFMDIDNDQNANWGRMMYTLSVHYKVLHTLREEAKKYLADKIANEGGNPGKMFTEEDLRLLYPERLVWSSWVSGVYEHRYDPYLLAEWLWEY